MIGNKLVFLLFIILISSCNPNTQNYQNLDSSNFKNKEERISELNKIVRFHAEVLDVEFELFNVNGFGDSRVALPAPSYSHYNFLIKVKPSDINLWINRIAYDRNNSIQSDSQMFKKLTSKRKKNWKVNSLPEYYGDRKSYIVVYRKEGIIFRSIYQD